MVERSIADHFADMYLLPVCMQAGGEGAVLGSSTEGPSGCEFVRAQPRTAPILRLAVRALRVESLFP